jgi:hypothetical protein
MKTNLVLIFLSLCTILPVGQLEAQSSVIFSTGTFTNNSVLTLAGTSSQEAYGEWIHFHALRRQQQYEHQLCGRELSFLSFRWRHQRGYRF